METEEGVTQNVRSSDTPEVVSTEEVPFTVAGVVDGYRKCIPIALGVFAYGLVFGVLANQAGLTAVEAALMSAAVLAGAAQLIAMEMWADPVPVFAIVLTTLVVNLRYLLMGAALRPWFEALSPSKAYSSAFFMADENWALTIAEYRSGNVQGAFLLGSGLAIFSFWIVATVVGVTAGSAVDDPERWGLDFAFTAVFLTLLVGIWDGTGDLFPWAVAGSSAIVAAEVLPGSWYIVVGGLFGSLAAVSRRA
ncbi:AzlC family ABC transporter permease [Natronobiforma cellulositropha]|uniref:AzlC family ABC transporter permease n=1 Tax=Natronobiforma cellulositropha TaxID=1679076 RepID=UPI0021D612FC|nr:AzlC family ABC transporter permease [Natronobiforma cellulositropha]